MSTQLNLRKLLHRKQWEVCALLPVATAAGVCSRHLEMPAYNIDMFSVITSTNQQYVYDCREDAFELLVASGLSGPAFGAGACSFISPIGNSGTATAGTTTTLTTNLTLNRWLAGYKIRITGGPSAAGQELTILGNTIGANAVITVAAQAAAFTTATTYTLLTPRLWYFCPGTTAVGLAVYDFATNTWTTKSVTGLPTSFGTDGKLSGTPGIKGGTYATQSGSTFGSCSTTVLTLSAGPNWTVNQWANSQLRVTGGTGAGQIRSIASNTALTLTLSSALTTALDNTSTWVIEGNDDYLYLIGNGAVAMYRYSISGNTWTTLSPASARSAAPGAGCSLDWVHTVNDASGVYGDWANANAIRNGRYLYSFRGGGSGSLDLYDIAGNTWISGQTYGYMGGEAFNTGSSFEYDDNTIYALGSNLLRVLKLDLVKNELVPLSHLTYPQGTGVVGDKMAIGTYIDGATKLKFLYTLRNSGQEMLRQLLF